MPLVFGGVGVQPSTRGQPSNWYTLQPGACVLIPSGDWMVKPGKYSAVQEYDPITTTWRTVGGHINTGGVDYVHSDGVNFRIANQSGCIVGGMVNTPGAGYTSAPVVTTSLSSGVWTAVVGGAVNTSVTMASGGANYLYPPFVAFSFPPSPGVPATGICAMSGGIVTGVTVLNQGAGYTSPPTISFFNDPRDTTGYGAAANCSLTGGGTVTAVLCNDHGLPVTANTTSLPTFTLSGGGYTSQAAAVCVMNWQLTTFTITAGGTSGLPATGTVAVIGFGTGLSATGASLTNPAIGSNLVSTRPGLIIPTTSGGAITAVGTIIDGGVYAGVNMTPAAVGVAVATLGATISLTAPGFSGTNDDVGIFPA